MPGPVWRESPRPALLLLALALGACAQARPAPILDTHIHLYQVSRAEGVPWPKPEQKALYRDVLPPEYESAAGPLGIVGAGVVEASNRAGDAGWVLGQMRGRPLFRFHVAEIEIGAPDFLQRLSQLVADPRVVGVRAFLWGPKLTLERTQLEHLRELARRGLTLDLVSRRTLNPKPLVAELARAVPELRIIIDHLGGARGRTPDPRWVAEMTTLAGAPNVHVKISSLYDMWNPASSEIQPWSSPRDVESYRPHLDVLLAAFGPERLIFGSNWPVCELGGTLGDQIRIVEEWLGPHGRQVRDLVMYRNAERFYRRVPPASVTGPAGVSDASR